MRRPQHRPDRQVWTVSLIQRKASCSCGGTCPRCRSSNLRISQPGDRHEKEADRVANRVLRMANPVRSAPAAYAESRSSARGDLSDNSASSGHPLSSSLRSFFEPRFGYDLSGVRLHRDSQAARSAQGFDARAYTVGRDITFASGEYSPETSSGRLLIAHELTHTIQQGGVQRRLGTAPTLGITRTPSEAIQRTPGEDAQDSWDAIIESVQLPEGEARQRVAREAIRRFLLTTSGANLVHSLWRMFCRGQQRCRSRISVLFPLERPPETTDASGKFDPDTPNAPRYTVWVQSREPRDPNSRAIPLGGSWPTPRNALIVFSYTDPESSMASTLHHELLHVWFVNARRSALFPTGHGANVERGEIEPEFLRYLRRFSGELDALEERLKNEARRREEERRRTALEAERAAQRTEPVTEPEPERAPSNVGGSVSLRGGGFGGQGVSPGGAAIVGADLILGRIASLNLGARGVYLSPDHLLVGGTVGTRILESSGDRPGFGGRVSNPLFFDLEAGLLAEIPTREVGRLRGNFHLMISAGVGQEFGTEGARFFWRVGGFVLISDEAFSGSEGVLGGGTAGVGVRF